MRRFLNEYARRARPHPQLSQRQLDFPPVLALEPSRREATQQEHERRIREYLGLQTFDLPTQEQIERRVCRLPTERLSPAEIVPHGETVCVKRAGL